MSMGSPYAYRLPIWVYVYGMGLYTCGQNTHMGQNIYTHNLILYARCYIVDYNYPYMYSYIYTINSLLVLFSGHCSIQT